MANVYFGNSVSTIISVNINDDLSATKIASRSTSPPSGPVNMINCPAIQIPTGPNKDKGIFGTGGGIINKVEIQYTFHSESDIYRVQCTNLEGRNLFFYVFDNALIGQDETGLSDGITITGPEKKVK